MLVLPRMRRHAAYCGSIDPRHSIRGCRDCRRISKKRRAQGLPPIIRDPAVCVFCNLAQGNSLGVKVIRYPLLRHIDKGGRHTSVCIGSLALCDDCVMQHGAINERTRRAA